MFQDHKREKHLFYLSNIYTPGPLEVNNKHQVQEHKIKHIKYVETYIS